MLYRISFILAFVCVAAVVSAQNVLASKEFEAKDATSVYINGKFCDVIVKKGSKVYFKGVIEGRGDEGDYEIYSDMSGSRLDIRVMRNTRSWDQVSRSRFELTVPDNVDVDIDNSSGDVYVSGISTEEFRIEASSGDIELVDLNGDMSIETSSGDIDAEEITGSIEIESTSGDQNLKGIMGSLDAQSTSGDIEISEFKGDLMAESTSGDIEVRRGEGGLRLRATSGEIDGYGIMLTDDAELRTSSGNISLEFDNDTDELSFDLRTSSGNLSVGSRRSDKSLYMKQGNIWIRGVTSSGNQRYQ